MHLYTFHTSDATEYQSLLSVWFGSNYRRSFGFGFYIFLSNGTLAKFDSDDSILMRPSRIKCFCASSGMVY